MMRINLITPFAEKDQVKALGARWDSQKKVWYIVDVEDLSPFLRWIPGASEPPDLTRHAAKPVRPSKSAHAAVAHDTSALPPPPPHCGCPVLPWEACVHSSAVV